MRLEYRVKQQNIEMEFKDSSESEIRMKAEGWDNVKRLWSGKQQQCVENGRETRFYFQKLLNIDYSLLIFALGSIILSILYYEADYNSEERMASACLYLLLFMLPIQISVAIMRYRVKLLIEKCQKILDTQETMFSSNKIYELISQIFLLILQPYIFLNDWHVQTRNIYDGYNFFFKFNYILVFFNFMKMFIIVRVILLHQIYMDPRSSRLCRMYGCSSDYLYAIKCLFKDSPIILIGIVFVFSVGMFAINLRIAERDVHITYKIHFPNQKLMEHIESIQNALWLTIITMTTVGYGDFFPRTVFGRIIDILLVVWGTFIVSLMVVVLTNTLNMDQTEKRALIVLNRLEAKKSLKEAAAYLITHTCRKYLLKKKVQEKFRPPLSEEEQSKVEAIFYKYLINFQNIKRHIRSMYEIDDTYQQMTRQFQFINDQISFLQESQDQVNITIENYLESKKKESESEEYFD